MASKAIEDSKIPLIVKLYFSYRRKRMEISFSKKY
jgi:hypothetical protein